MSAREVALQVLTTCRKEEGWVNEVLKKQLARSGLDPRDAGLATRLCYGVVQNRIRLDFYISQLLTGKRNDLHPVLRDVLRIGLYQIFYMDKIPVSAAVNESVTLAKKHCRPLGPVAASLTNGVLRNAIRLRGTLREPQTLWESYSHPEGLVSLFRAYVGQDKLEPMLMANNAAPDTVIQVNTLKTTAQKLRESLEQDGAEVQPHPWMADCFIIRGAGNLERLSAFQDGGFYVQDAAARLSVDVAGIRPGMKVVDCCAAPGGKSFAAARLLEGRGEIFASDLHEHRTELIRKGAERLGVNNITVSQRDASQEVRGWEEIMDAVIVDVPCSGYGIIRKKPDIRYKDPDTMKELPALQLEILKTQARMVRPGGTLIYSTCTLVRRENEGVVEKFLKAREDFFLEALELPDVFPKNETGMLTLVPGEYETDGFFIAKLRRKA